MCVHVCVSVWCRCGEKEAGDSLVLIGWKMHIVFILKCLHLAIWFERHLFQRNNLEAIGINSIWFNKIIPSIYKVGTMVIPGGLTAGFLLTEEGSWQLPTGRPQEGSVLLVLWEFQLPVQKHCLVSLWIGSFATNSPLSQHRALLHFEKKLKIPVPVKSGG